MRSWALVAGLALAGLTPNLVRAASYDPTLTWQTAHTEHFNITFHQGEESLAQEMAGLCEGVYARVSAQIGTDLRRPVELLLVDSQDSANGYASRLPVNTIVIYVTAPQEDSSLNLYRNWNEAILTHELTHILHLETIGGLPRVLRLVLGRIISVNDLSPAWLVEGLATYEETLLTEGGRGRACQADMVKRMTTLEGHFPPLGNLDGYQSDPPGGNLRYLFGQDFMQFIARTTGEEKLQEWVHTYGSWVLPYVLPARRVFGKSFRTLYKEWRADAEARYGAQRAAVEAEGLTVGALVSDGEANCASPLFSLDGTKLIYSCTDRRSGSAIWLAGGNGESPERIHRGRTAAKSFSWRNDSQAFVFAAADVVDYYNVYYDIWHFDLALGEPSRVTEGQRARDPELSPDGQQLLVVTNAEQNNQLARYTIDQQLVALTHNQDRTQISTPRFSPDGRWVALSVWQAGQRDLWLYRPDGSPYWRITADDAIDQDPAWSPDGSTLFFVSDRTGIANVYALDLADHHLWRVTNVLGGAFHPTIHPDGTRLAYADFSYNGADIRILPVDRTGWKDEGRLPGGEAPKVWTQLHTLATTAGAATAPPAEAGLPAEAGPQSTNVTLPAADWGPEPYNPLPTLLPPRYLMPNAYIAEYGLLGYLGTGGSDSLRRYSYSGYLTYRTDNRFIGGGGSLVLNRWHPIFSLGANISAIRYGTVYTETQPPPEGGTFVPSIEQGEDIYYDKRTRLWAQATIPVKRWENYYIRYNGQIRTNLDPLPDDAYLPYLPTRGFLSTIGGGWRYARSDSYAYSISAEQGRNVAVVGQVTSALLGAYTLDDDGNAQPFDQVQLTGEWREYVTNPWLANQVLALRGAAGMSLGDNINYGSFRLGGSYGEGSLYVLPEEYRSLRGFPVASAYGDWYYLISAEYRLPLMRIDRGFGTLPAFIRTLHGAVFTDVGNAFEALPSGAGELGEVLGGTLVGLGAELRLGVVLGWGWGFTGRLGYAFALAGDGYAPGDLQGLYAQMGTSF